MKQVSTLINVVLALLVVLAVLGNANLAAAAGTVTIQAKLLASHECNSQEWHFVINQIDTEAHSPTSIHVIWANGNQEDVPLEKTAGGVAHYKTSSNLSSYVTSATAEIYTAWAGEFNLSHGPCQTTGAELIKFSAIAKYGNVLVEWTTGFESTIMGFDIVRSTYRDGTYKRVNKNTIAPKCLAQICGATYKFHDKSVKVAKAYFYKLRIYHVGGGWTWSDVVKVKVK